MIYYKLYLEKDGMFTSLYQPGYCNGPLVQGKMYYPEDTKASWALASKDIDERETGFFGLNSPESVLKYFASDYPIQGDFMFDWGDICATCAVHGMPVICTCVGSPKDMDDSWKDFWNNGDEVQFKNQIIIRIERRLSLKDIYDIISDAYNDIEL